MAPVSQIAKDVGISDSCLRNRLRAAHVERGLRDGPTEAETAELREANRRIRLLEQENGVLRRPAAYGWFAAPITRGERQEAYVGDALLDAHRDHPENGYRLLRD